MKSFFAPILALAACLFAAGCTDSDWNRMLNYGGLGDGDTAPQPAATAAAESAAAAPAAAPPGPGAPPNADFCRSVATQDATRNDFDQATQQRVFARSLQQCEAIYTR